MDTIGHVSDTLGTFVSRHTFLGDILYLKIASIAHLKEPIITLNQDCSSKNYWLSETKNDFREVYQVINHLSNFVAIKAFKNLNLCDLRKKKKAKIFLFYRPHFLNHLSS